MAEAAPLVIGNHHAQCAVGARLLNDVGRGQHSSTGIDDHSRAANAGTRRLVILRAQEGHRGTKSDGKGGILPGGVRYQQWKQEGEEERTAPVEHDHDAAEHRRLSL